MKLKHNKKRNTAFLYEVLVRHLTKSVLEKDLEKKKKILNVIKEHFHKKSLLYKELELYKAFLSEDRYDHHTAEKLIFEAKRTLAQLDKQQLFNEQSDLIRVINQTLSKDAYSIFVPNYKTVASIQQIFNDQVPIKTRVLLESKVIHALTSKRHPQKSVMPTVDNIVYRTFIKKFNKQYGESLLEEQRGLLGKYITSFSDNGMELKLYLNEEIKRLKDLVEGSLKKEEIILQEETTNKIKEVLKVIDDFKNQEVDQEMVERVLKIQSLVNEI
jgi:hypothetical protein